MNYRHLPPIPLHRRANVASAVTARWVDEGLLIETAESWNDEEDFRRKGSSSTSMVVRGTVQEISAALLLAGLSPLEPPSTPCDRPAVRYTTVNISDTQIPPFDADGAVALWGIRGLPYRWPSKMCAEMVARNAFPNEDADKRYARIFYELYERVQ